METRRGIASKVRIGSEVSGTVSDGRGSIATKYVAVFELDGVVVHAGSTRPPTVADGDEIVVAGSIDDGVFTAPALRNLTRGTLDHEAWVVGLAVGTVFVVVGVGLAIGVLLGGSDAEKLVALFGVAFAAAGAWVARASNRIRVAEVWVRRI